jgi:hypothetical protein
LLNTLRVRREAGMGERRTLLVVEDGRAINAMLMECFADRFTVLSAHVGAEALPLDDRFLGFEVGADDYLEKPVGLPHLKRAIERRRRPPAADRGCAGTA